MLAALEDPSPLVREQAIRLSEQFFVPPRGTTSKNQRPPLDKGGLQGGFFSSIATSANIRQKLLEMTGDPDDRVLFQLLCTLGTNVDEAAFAVDKNHARPYRRRMVPDCSSFCSCLKHSLVSSSRTPARFPV